MLIRDIDRAYALAPPLDDEKDRMVPDVELPDLPETPSTVNYGEMLDQ